MKMTDNKHDDDPHFHIVGGGPVGYATALLLAKDGIHSTVYESRVQVVNVPEESYPIGVNARGLHTLGLIDPSLAASCRDTGKIINAWEIYGGGGSKVADLPSGVVYGTSRARVNLILAEAALRPVRSLRRSSRWSTTTGFAPSAWRRASWSSRSG